MWGSRTSANGCTFGADHLHRVLIAACYGTRRSMTLSITTRTGHSFIHSNWRVAWLVSRSSMKRKLGSSRRKWTRGRRTQAKAPRQHHSKVLAHKPLPQYSQMERPRADLAVCQACYMVNARPRLHTYRNLHLHFPHRLHFHLRESLPPSVEVVPPKTSNSL